MSNNVVYFISEDTNLVNICVDGSDIPFIVQPNWPNGEEWASVEEATLWAEAKVLEINDATAPMAPVGPGLEPVERTLPEEAPTE